MKGLAVAEPIGHTRPPLLFVYLIGSNGNVARQLPRLGVFPPIFPCFEAEFSDEGPRFCERAVLPQSRSNGPCPQPVTHTGPLTNTPTSAASMMRRVIVQIAFISSSIEPILCSQIAVHLSFFHHGEMMEDMTYDACKMLV